MSSTQMVVLAIVLITLVACALGAWSVLRRRALRPSGTRPAGEHKLRELSPQARAMYAAAWRQLQVKFLDSPQETLNAADDLVTRLVVELGYPTGDDDKQAEHLSVDHAGTFQSYREAHEVSASNRRGEATTEQLRLAVVQFRAIVAELLGGKPAVV